MSEAIQEKSIITCKICKEDKERFLDGRFPDGVNKRWKDSEGKAFNGLTCPKCHKEKTKANMSRLRSKFN